MHKLSIQFRLRLSLIIVIGAALLKPGAWLHLGAYGAIAFIWALCLRTKARRPLAGAKPSLLQLLGAELILLSLMALPLGWQRASFLLVRSVICLLVMNSFLFSLPPHTFAIALKGLPLPARLQENLLLTAQYLEILLSEVTRMQRAAKIRGLNGPAGWLRYVSAAAIGSIYIRSLDRAERVYSAMVARGYQGKLPVDSKSTPFELTALTIAALLATFLTVISYLKF